MASSAAREERLIGALEALEMPQTEHPVDMPIGIDEARRDVVAGAEVAENRHPLERLVFVVEALPGAEIHLRDASVPVEIGPLGGDKMLDNGVNSVAAELGGQVAAELREAVERGVRMRVKRGHRNLHRCCPPHRGQLPPSAGEAAVKDAGGAAPAGRGGAEMRSGAPAQRSILGGPRILDGRFVLAGTLG